MRKLVKTLLSLLLVAPAAALALGVGEMQLNSALNQRLDAEIKLLSVDPAEADSIEVTLASYEDFAKVGLERPASLMFLQFNVEQRPGGDYFIKLGSREPIRDPFLDFLIEVKWRSGRLLREYTLLLDPPLSYREAAPAITAPTTTPATSAAPSAPEEEFVPPPSSIPVAPEIRESTTMPDRMPAEAVPSPDEIVYGPVKADDTLWAIALKLRPSSDVSVQQMMLALLKANPYAFFDNNINRLKKGFVLRIDDPAMITAMNKAEAAREVSRQTREWQDYRAAVAARASQRQAVGATEEPGTEVAAAKSEPKLELVAPEGKAAEPAAPGASAESLEQDLMLALESSAAQRKENEELQQRVQGLEEQLQDMQRLLSLKDADLAALQQQLREQGAAVSLPSESATEETPPAAEAPEPAQEAPEAAATEEPAAAETKPAPAAKPAPKKPVPPPVQEPGLVDMILGDTLMLTAVGGTLLLILVLVLLMIRRRRAGGFQESILSGRISSIMSEKSEADTSETSFLSDLAVSGMGGGAIHADEGEVDPLTEADVFMAYGRHQQAEEVLNKALEKNPERVELTAKLLEVYYNLRDAERFAALSEENEESLKADAAMWARVTAMGQELLPENPLFEVIEDAEAEAETATAPSVKPEPISEDVLDIGLDLDELTAEMESEGGGSDLGLDLGLDFGDLEEEEAKPATGAGEEEAEAEGPYEFDLELGEEETGEEAAHEFELDLGPESAEGPAAEPAAEEDIGLELEPGEMAEEAGQPGAEEPPDLDVETGAEESAGEEGEGLDLGDLEDFDFGELGLETGAEEGAPSLETPAEEASLDMSELESPAEEAEEIGNLGEYDDLSDLDEEDLLSDSEEIATKLDLAQAYIEMGDNEGARSMLEEVAEAGNDEQKQQAQELLQKV